MRSPRPDTILPCRSRSFRNTETTNEPTSLLRLRRSPVNRVARLAARRGGVWPSALNRRSAWFTSLSFAFVGLTPQAFASDRFLFLALALAGGYPYFLQSVGKHVWDVARRSPIAMDDVEVGSALARAEVDEGLYRSRWERATPAQRELLRALGASPARSRRTGGRLR